MEMEVLFTYKNQLLASDGYTCVTSTRQKVEWSRAFYFSFLFELEDCKMSIIFKSSFKKRFVLVVTTQSYVVK